MAASLDGFIARRDGRTDWLETSDTFEGGETMSAEVVAAFLKTIDCYVMGSRTYETALDFEAKGFGWAYGDTPVFVLTTRALPRTRASVHFRTGDVAALITGELRPSFRGIWVAGGGAVAGARLRDRHPALLPRPARRRRNDARRRRRGDDALPRADRPPTRSGRGDV